MRHVITWMQSSHLSSIALFAGNSPRNTRQLSSRWPGSRMSQFAFLSAEFSDVFAHASKAESMALSDPRAACFYARLALEVGVNWVYDHDSAVRDPFETTLAARVHEPSFRAVAGNGIITKARIIKDLGNAAVHEPR